ncbi:thioredoxin domain-containing protein [bacterium]|nr:thioredoxin domain-containing protein [bacterium]MBU1434683.1 thioredoxin domain-containing protein [bacterium]MBU1502670.1 thioredoxin domain-containing protein [bacterium]
MNELKTKKIPWIIMIMLIIVGLFFSIYLTTLHAKVFLQKDFGVDSSICSISEGFNCETVAENPYSVFLRVPVSVWGIIGYLFMLAGAIMGLRTSLRRMALGWSTAFVGIGCLVSVTLGYISVTKITSICIFCFGTYLINFTLMGILIYQYVRNRLNPVSIFMETLFFYLKRPLITGAIAAGGLAVVISLILAYPKYWKTDYKKSDDLGRLAQGKSENGRHWIGARTPVITITEISDYECPFCSNYQKELRKLVSKYPEKIRMEHVHYPLDQACNPLVTRPFHLAACDKAKIAICASKQGKFWEANDYIFAMRTKRVTPYMVSLELKLNEKEMANCMKDPSTKEELMKDITFGNSMKILGTPAYLVNGERVKKLSIEFIENLLKMSSGVDEHGNHWIGAQNPVVTIDEFSDYECPFCKKFHMVARDLVSKYSTKIKLVHHHYPLDQACNSIVPRPFHKKACTYSIYASCAGKQGKFWETNDYIFRHRKSGIFIQDLVKELGLNQKDFTACTSDPKSMEKLKKEIQVGIEKNLTGTPTYYINGKQVGIKELIKTVEGIVKK